MASAFEMIKDIEKNFYKDIEEKIPYLYKRLLKKNFPSIEGYLNYSDLQTLIGINCIYPLQVLETDKSAVHAFYLSWYWLQHHCPVYWVSEELLESVINTKLPKDLDIQDIRWPMHSFVLMLPLNKIKTPDSGDIGFIIVGHRNSGSQIFVPTEVNVGITENEKEIWGWYTIGLKNLHAFTGSYHMNTPISEIIDSDNDDIFVSVFLDKFTEDDKKFSTQLNSVIFKLLLALASKPALTTEGSFTKRAKMTFCGKKQKINLYSHNWIGENYRVAGRPVNGTHLSPELHWRKGHFRLQRHGKLFSKIKSIWIEPVLIGAANVEFK